MLCKEIDNPIQTYLGFSESWIRFWPYFRHAWPSSSLSVVTASRNGLSVLPYIHDKWVKFSKRLISQVILVLVIRMTHLKLYDLRPIIGTKN
jgi:hypothetical protein